MQKRKSRLGRGLDNLLKPTQTETDEVKGTEIQQVDINAIDPNPYQPRVDFDESEIAGLAESIKNQGLLQPIVVRKTGNRYQIVSGERRFRAHRHLRRDSISCVIKSDVSDNEMLELALVENIQREQLNEIETALAYQKLIGQCGYTHEELAKKVGKSRAAITNGLRLLNLPDEIQQMVRAGAISMGHARAILSLDGEAAQLDAARKIVSDKLTVRDVEQLGRADAEPAASEAASAEPSGKTPVKSKEETPLDPVVADVLEKLQYKFGAPVKLKGAGGSKGKLEIEYYSENDLTRLFDILLGGN